MKKSIAFDAIVWLINSSGHNKKLRVNLIGGEPLICFDLIKELVPFAKRRAYYHGKAIHFSTTTNCTLITDEIISFWKKWRMGFHCSIDGVPKIQDINRPLYTGGCSSALVEAGVKKILTYQHNACARATIAPKNINLTENYNHFRSLGFTNIAFVCCDADAWDNKSLIEFDTEVRCLISAWIKDIRKGLYIKLKYVDDLIKKRIYKKCSFTMCGAGRGMVLVDINGGIWPCHRWNKERHKEWNLGSIYGEFIENSRNKLDVKNQVSYLNANCSACFASEICTGGCPAENLEICGSPYYITENKCRIQKIWHKYASKAFDIISRENLIEKIRIEECV